jgi:site-specific DNA recombinase
LIFQKFNSKRLLQEAPLYYGYFRWGGKLYQGNHIFLISREPFERVQEVLANRHKAKERQHQLPFKGFLTCGHCGCAITAEEHIKKKSGKRYAYYRCTGFKKNCAEPYRREEVISEKFGEILKISQINEEILSWIIEALKESNEEEKAYHHGMVSSLNRELSKIQNRLAKIYEDRLDGLITTELWEQKDKKCWLEQEAIKRKLQATSRPTSSITKMASGFSNSPNVHISFIKPKIFPNSGNFWISSFRTAS